jgi:hypothetical protein
VRISAGLLGEVSATSSHTLPAGEIVGQPITIALRCVCGIGLVCQSFSVGYNAPVGNSSYLDHDIEDSRSDSDGDPVLTWTIIYCVSGTFTSCWNAVDDSDAVFVVRWVLMTLVANTDITMKKRKFECFVLSAFEYTIRWFETVE